MRLVKTDKELKKIAMGYMEGTVFSDRHIHESDALGMIPIIFMPIGLMEKKDFQELLDDGMNMIYEEMDKAGPRSVNGYPMFMSFQFLTKEEVVRLAMFVDDLKDFVEKDRED